MKNLSKKAVILSLSLVVVSPLVHKINAQDIEKNREVRYETRKANNLENMTMEEAFPDENFRKVICDKLSILDDGNPIGISQKAIIESTKGLTLGSKSIKNLSGINYFIGLENFSCRGNNLTSLDLSSNINLKELYCNENQLTSLDLSNNRELTTLHCGENNLADLVIENSKLDELNCRKNNLKSLDITKATNLTTLLCYKNKLDSLNTSKNKNLKYLYCSQNELTSLDVTKNTELVRLYCGENRLTSLDVSKNTKLKELDWSNQKKSTSTGGSSGSGGGSLSTNEESSEPTSTPSKEKLTGADRNETSVKISQKGWNKADNIVLINDSSISDALSATPFAKSKDAPILLTKNNNLNKLTEKEINRLEAKNVYIVGGLKSVDEKVVSDLKKKGLNVIRISGNDRYETSIKLAKELDKNSNLSKVVVVNGEKGLADAVSMGAISAKEEMPILLTNQNDDMKDIKDLIANKNISKSYVIGGESLFNNKEVNNTLPSVTKIAGSDRTETNSKVISHFYSKDTLNDLYVAKNGMNKQDDLVDALSVGVLAGKTESPVVLVGNGLDNSQKEFIKNKKFKNITQIGGNGNEKAFNEVENLVK